MARDFETRNDMIPDTGSSAGDTRSDSVSDLAGDAGVDLNASEISKADGLAKATMMLCDAPPPPDYSDMATRSPDSAIYTEAPEHAGRTPEQVAAEMAEAWDYAGPANEPEVIEEPPKPDYGDGPPDEDEK